PLYIASRPWASRYSRFPVERSSSTVTRWPACRSASTRCEPMNPAPPVTRALISLDRREELAAFDPARVTDLAHLLRCALVVLESEHDEVDVVSGDHVVGVGEGAEDRDAVHLAEPLAGIVVEEADRPMRRLHGAGEKAQRDRAALGGSRDEHAALARAWPAG